MLFLGRDHGGAEWQCTRYREILLFLGRENDIQSDNLLDTGRLQCSWLQIKDVQSDDDLDTERSTRCKVTTD